jgi:hypothetical protein
MPTYDWASATHRHSFCTRSDALTSRRTKDQLTWQLQLSYSYRQSCKIASYHIKSSINCCLLLDVLSSCLLVISQPHSPHHSRQRLLAFKLPSQAGNYPTLKSSRSRDQTLDTFAPIGTKSYHQDCGRLLYLPESTLKSSVAAMSNPDFLNRAIQTVTKAVESDTAGNYQEAYKLYTNARKKNDSLVLGVYTD